MPEVFSPSRSLKYCRMTLRTVEESSLSRTLASPFVSYLCCLRCKGNLVVVVFELAGMRLQLIEEARDGFELQRRGLEGIHAGAERGGILQALRVPADVLARDAHPALVAVEAIQVVHVGDQHLADLGHFGRGQLVAGL